MRSAFCLFCGIFASSALSSTHTDKYNKKPFSAHKRRRVQMVYSRTYIRMWVDGWYEAGRKRSSSFHLNSLSVVKKKHLSEQFSKLILRSFTQRGFSVQTTKIFVFSNWTLLVGGCKLDVTFILLYSIRPALWYTWNKGRDADWFFLKNTAALKAYETRYHVLRMIKCANTCCGAHTVLVYQLFEWQAVNWNTPDLFIWPNIASACIHVD